MAKMWAGVTAGKTDSLADDFNSSIRFDSRMARQDITGSIAHAAMLGKCGIITEEEAQHFIDHHPNCIVDFQPSHAATVDGWRSENPHYKHYIWCFKNRQWIPFNEDLPGVKKSE